MRSTLHRIITFTRSHLVLRMILLISVTVVIVSISSTTAFYFLYRAKLLSVFETELENKKGLIETSYGVPLWDFQKQYMRHMNEALLSPLPYKGVVLYDGASEEERETRLATRKTTFNGKIIFEHSDSPLIFTQHNIEKISGKIIHQNRAIGSYELFYTKKHVNDHLRTSFIGWLFSTLFISIATILMLSLLLRRVLIKRLLALVAFARQVATDHQYNRKIQVHVPDEVGNLEGSVNYLLEQVEQKNAETQEARDQLLKHYDRLEEKVKERTIQLEYARDAAEAANQAKTDFLSRMSHELRTPLNAILGYTQIFQQQHLNQNMQKGVRTIHDCAEHLLTLINDILNLSKIESGKLELINSVFDFHQFIQGISDTMYSRAGGKKLDFDCAMDACLPNMICADETRLRQILFNLLTNAVKFTNEGRITLRVTNEGTRPPSKPGSVSRTTLRFDVEDTGIGIDKMDIPRLFKPFEQVASNERWSEGTGLGLAISRQLARLMGGDLFVRSTIGEGSLFWFTIEADVLTCPASEKESRQADLIPIGYDGPPRHILVVDDIPSNRAVLRDMLVPLGFQLNEAANGSEAVDLARTHPPDLILMDCHMPVMDGFTAAEVIKKETKLNHIPLVAVTASIMDADRAKVNTFGFDAFLPKPVRLPLLVMVIDRCLHLAWHYAEPIEKRTVPRRTEACVAPSLDVLNDLIELAQSGDMNAIEDRALQLRETSHVYTVFADRLVELARRFEDQTIREWLQSEYVRSQ